MFLFFWNGPIFLQVCKGKDKFVILYCPFRAQSVTNLQYSDQRNAQYCFLDIYNVA
jgi:hypothetical protein